MSAPVASMKSFAIIGCLAALSATTLFYAVLSIGASNQAARTASALVLGPAIFVADSPVHPVRVAILLAVATVVVHFSYWWFAILEPWPSKLSIRLSIIVAVHFGSVIVFWVKHSFEQLP